MSIIKDFKHLADGQFGGKGLRAVYRGDERAWPGVEFIGSNTSAGPTVPIPSHRAGDLLVIAAFWPINSPSQAVPSGWSPTIAPAGAAVTGYFAVAERLATTSTTTSGTWTGASRLMVLVYRGGRAIGNWSWERRTDRQPINSPSLLSPYRTDGTSRVVRGVFSPSALPSIAPPPGYTSRATASNGAIIDANTLTSVPSEIVLVTPPSLIAWHAFTFEVTSSASTRQASDGFNRSDSTTSLGGRWITRAGTMGINSNAAYPIDAAICTAMYPYPLASDDMEVSMVVGSYAGDALTTGRPSYLILGADEAVGAAVWLRVGRESSNLLIFTVNNWARESFTTRATIPHGGIVTGDEFTLRRIDNHYIVLKNGDEIGEWVDEDDIVARGRGRRFVGVGGWGGGSNPNYQRIDSWSARAAISVARIEDGFNRGNSVLALGGQWITRAGTMGINSNAAYPIDAAICTAMYAIPLALSDMEVSLRLGTHSGDALTAERTAHLILGANTAGEAVWVELFPASGDFRLMTVGDWARTSYTERAIGPHGGMSQGDEFTLRRIDNHYIVLKNGDEIGEWVDEDSILPRDEDHRLVGVGGWGGSPSPNYWRIDHFAARILYAAEPPEPESADATTGD